MPLPGDVEDYVTGVRRSLGPAYRLEALDFEGRTSLVGHRSDFRWRWGGVRLFTTVTVTPFDSSVDTALLDEYLAACGRAARGAAPRRTLGLQTGAAAVAVVVVPTVSPEVRQWAARPHGHRFASVGYPVAVGLAPAEVVEPERMLTGRVFRSFLRSVVAEVTRST
jgi:hypothetical protein